MQNKIKFAVSRLFLQKNLSKSIFLYKTIINIVDECRFTHPKEMML
jgi:hypothetical protein